MNKELVIVIGDLTICVILGMLIGILGKAFKVPILLVIALAGAAGWVYQWFATTSRKNSGFRLHSIK